MSTPSHECLSGIFVEDFIVKLKKTAAFMVAKKLDSPGKDLFDQALKSLEAKVASDKVWGFGLRFSDLQEVINDLPKETLTSRVLAGFLERTFNESLLLQQRNAGYIEEYNQERVKKAIENAARLVHDRVMKPSEALAVVLLDVEIEWNSITEKKSLPGDIYYIHLIEALRKEMGRELRNESIHIPNDATAIATAVEATLLDVSKARNIPYRGRGGGASSN